MTKLSPIEELTYVLAKQLRQAIIRDFVSKQKAVGYLCTKLPIDGRATIYQVEQDEVSVNPNGHFNTPLYDLSEWMEK
jgi:hypothetical protein